MVFAAHPALVINSDITVCIITGCILFLQPLIGRKLYTLKTHQIIKFMQSSQTRGCTSRGQCWRMPTFTNYCDVSCWYMCCCASLICSGQTLTCGYESAAASSAARLNLPTPQVPLKLTADFKTAKSTFPLWDKTVQSSTFVVVFILCALGIKDDQTFKKQPRGLKSSCITVIGTSLKTLHYESLQFLGSKLSLPHMFGDLTCCCISLTFCSTWLPHCYTLSCTVTRSPS